MNQPECDFGEGVEIAPPPPDPPANPAFPAYWFLLGMLVALAIFELWALHSHHNTVSQWLQHVLKRRKWLRWVAAVGWAVLGWHLFWGFPR